MNNQSISIVVPTLNEEGNLKTLLRRIDNTLRPAHITYEVVIVDDHSSDDTIKVARELQTSYPVMVYEKRGTRGKAHSLLEGFDKCRYETVAMIDADLQYPPEALLKMHAMLNESGADVVVTRRNDNKTSPLRKLSSYIFNLVFSKMLFGIDFDTQSGLKLFKKRVLNNFQMTPSPWSFDQEFIVRSLEHKFKIISHTIPFSERNSGATKVKLLNVTYELARASVILRWHTSFGKIREGSQANNRFIRRTFPLAIAMVLSLGILFVAPSPVNAATPDNSQRSSSGLIGVIQSIFAPNSNSGSNNSNSGNSNTNNQTPAIQPTATTPMTTPAPAPTTMAPATASAPTAVKPTTQAATVKVSAAVAPTPATTVASAVSTDTSSLAPATNANTTKNIYADGYPNYVLSDTSTHKLNSGAKAVLITGGAVLSVALLVSVYAGLRTRYQHAYIR